MTNYIVTNLNSSGAGSLSQAILDSEATLGADTITFAAGLAGGTITPSFSSGIFDDLVIDGDLNDDGIADITISGDVNGNGVADAGDTNHFTVGEVGYLELVGLNLVNGYFDANDGGPAVDAAGSIFNNGILVLVDTTISDSLAIGRDADGFIVTDGGDAAGAIMNYGLLEVLSSTGGTVVFDNNLAEGGDGAIGLDGEEGFVDGADGGNGGNAAGNILNTADGEAFITSLVTQAGFAVGGLGGDGGFGADSEFGPAGAGGDGGNGGSAAGGILNAGSLVGTFRAGDDSVGALGEGGFGGFGGAEFETGTLAPDGIDGFDGLEDRDYLDLTGNAVQFFEATTLGDQIFGTNLVDYIDGFEGNDVLAGLGGDDIVIGGAGNDYLNGGTGADLMAGGTGDDVFIVDRRQDEVVEFVGGGTDTILTAVSLVVADNVENARTLGAGNINLVGNTLDNLLLGNAGSNRMFGGDGNDILNGLGGADDMRGGAGNDTFYVDNVGDLARGESNDGGIDLVYTTVSHSLSGNVENAITQGVANINLTGNGLDNVLVGNEGDNVLNGRGGDDRMFGGAGDDTYIVNSGGDVVGEIAGNGTDTILSIVSLTLGNAIENATVIGNASRNLTGNALENVLTGNAGVNRLDGAAGDDTIRGGANLDYLTGGSGADVFVYGAASESGGQNSQRDRILDFQSGTDLIDLAGVDANAGVAGDQAFQLDTDGSFSAGEIRQTEFGPNLLIEINTNGDANAEMSFLLLNTGALAETDFIL